MFLKYAIDKVDKNCQYYAVDISKTSLDLTEKIISYFFNNSSLNIKFLNDDIINLDDEKKFDYISMGEILEHVNDPKKCLIN